VASLNLAHPVHRAKSTRVISCHLCIHFPSVQNPAVYEEMLWALPLLCNRRRLNRKPNFRRIGRPNGRLPLDPPTVKSLRNRLGGASGLWGREQRRLEYWSTEPDSNRRTWGSPHHPIPKTWVVYSFAGAKLQDVDHLLDMHKDVLALVTKDCDLCSVNRQLLDFIVHIHCQVLILMSLFNPTYIASIVVLAQESMITLLTMMKMLNWILMTMKVLI